MQAKTEDQPTRIARVYGTPTIREWSLDEVKAKGAWISSAYVDDDGLRQRIDPILEGSACILEIRADQLRSWHP